MSQSIDNSGNVGQHPELAIDSVGHLHISYRDLANPDSRILYATNRSGSWVIQNVSTGISVHQGSSIAIDSNDNVYLTYSQDQINLKMITYTSDGYLGWSITPDLPAGLTINMSTGVISGTPTVVSPATNYTITARNLGGNSSTNITIRVDDIAPIVTYAPNDDIVTTINTTISDVFPNVTGGLVTSWEISPNTNGYFHFNQTTGKISGSSNTLLPRTMFTIWANNSGGSAVVYINFTVNELAPGPFEYNPENNTVTNNTEFHLAPTFINQISGNGSAWQAGAQPYSGSGNSNPGSLMQILVGDTLYFDASNGSGTELWAHNTSNGTTWLVADIMPGGLSSFPGKHMEILVGDTIYFDALSCVTSSCTYTHRELWAHNTSNGTTWMVIDISPGISSSVPGDYMYILVGDTIYFSATTQLHSHEMWAHDTSNSSTWQVADINPGYANSRPGSYMHILVGDTIYFSATDGSTGQELWAHDTSNSSIWRVADIRSGSGGSNPGASHERILGDASM